MKISIHSLLDGTQRATGTVAVIDVFRAFTTAAVALSNGASEVIMVGTVDEALALREEGIGHICRGEVGGKPPPEFDVGSSPLVVCEVNFSGKTIIPSAGTQSIVAASRAERLYAASLVTASAPAGIMLAGAPEKVTLVAMGDHEIDRIDEDEVCAIHLHNLLEGRPGDRRAVQRLILAGGEVARFQDPARPHLHAEDADIALDIDRFDFAIRVVIEEGRPAGRVEKKSN